jgi:hypothetical protein
MLVQIKYYKKNIINDVPEISSTKATMRRVATELNKMSYAIYS